MRGGPDLSGEIVDRRYQIVERLSEGAMGVVYRGLRLKLDRAVAIKVMHASLPGAMEGKKRFEREAKLMARLEHPHCVSIIDYGIHADKPYVVMELVRGRSLFEVLDEHGRFEIPRAVDIMCQVLSGLAHAHDQGIIHRDIKPANIMITPKAPLGVHARILDFGLARMLGTSGSLSHGIAVGTPSYMAPEQCRGDKADARADIYSCGIVLFEMLTGKKPFIAKDPIAIVKKHLDEMPPLLAEVKPDEYGRLEGVVARALAKAPEDRYPSAIAMAEALDSALSGRGIPEATAVLPLVGSSSVNVVEESVEVPITVGSSVTQAAVDSTQLADQIVAELKAGTKADPPKANPPKADPPEAAPARPDRREDSKPDVRAPSVESRSALRRLLPVSRMRYVVIGAIVLVLAGAIGMAVARLGGDEEAPPDARGEEVASPVVDAVSDPARDLVASAEQLAASGKLESAIDMLLRARRRFPDRAELPLSLGKLYFSKMWWNDGIANLREALRLDPKLKRDPDLLKTVLRGFVSTPGYDERLAKLIVELGPTMIPLLEETARAHPKPDVRSRATTLLRKLR